MKAYLSDVRTLVWTLQSFQIERIPRSQNKQADALSKLASSSFSHLGWFDSSLHPMQSTYVAVHWLQYKISTLTSNRSSAWIRAIRMTSAEGKECLAKRRRWIDSTESPLLPHPVHTDRGPLGGSDSMDQLPPPREVRSKPWGVTFLIVPLYTHGLDRGRKPALSYFDTTLSNAVNQPLIRGTYWQGWEIG